MRTMRCEPGGWLAAGARSADRRYCHAGSEIFDPLQYRRILGSLQEASMGLAKVDGAFGRVVFEAYDIEDGA
jgi:hypothetical protein